MLGGPHGVGRAHLRFKLPATEPPSYSSLGTSDQWARRWARRAGVSSCLLATVVEYLRIVITKGAP